MNDRPLRGDLRIVATTATVAALAASSTVVVEPGARRGGGAGLTGPPLASWPGRARR